MVRLFKEMAIIGLAVIAGIYLANPTSGFFELIPDVVPFVGNLDETAAVLILMNTLRYYGIDLTNLWGDNPNKQPEQLPPPDPRR